MKTVRLLLLLIGILGGLVTSTAHAINCSEIVKTSLSKENLEGPSTEITKLEAKVSSTKSSIKELTEYVEFLERELAEVLRLQGDRTTEKSESSNENSSFESGYFNVSKLRENYEAKLAQINNTKQKIEMENRKYSKLVEELEAALQ